MRIYSVLPGEGNEKRLALIPAATRLRRRPSRSVTEVTLALPSQWFRGKMILLQLRAASTGRIAQYRRSLYEISICCLSTSTLWPSI